MSEHAPERIWSGIDIPKIIAGTLAAVSAAVVGSFLGVAGTLVGAAVASIVGSVGTEIYQRWINRGSQKIKSTFVTAPAAVGTPPVAAVPEETGPEQPRTIRWGRVAAVAGALFVLAMGLLTAVELISHKSVADAVGNKSSGATTVSSLWGGDSGKKRNQPVVTPSSPTPAPSEEPSQEPGATPSDTPSTTTTEPSEAPASDAPTGGPEPTTPAPADGGGNGDTGGDTSGDGGSGVNGDGGSGVNGNGGSGVNPVAPAQGGAGTNGTGSE